jgi:hypothetical protein
MLLLLTRFVASWYLEMRHDEVVHLHLAGGKSSNIQIYKGPHQCIRAFSGRGRRFRSHRNKLLFASDINRGIDGYVSHSCPSITTNST